MGSLGEQRRAENTFLIESEGCDGTLNGHTIKGFWQNVGLIAVQRFLRESELAKSAYEVRLPAYAYDAPYSIANGMEITNDVKRWRCVVRNVLDPELNDGVVIQCNVLVVGATE